MGEALLATRIARAEDARAVGARLREADRRELTAAGWSDPSQAPLESWRASETAFAAVERGAGPTRATAIFGVGPLDGSGEVGAPWLLATPEFLRHRRTIARRSRAWAARLQRDYRVLTNVVDARNAAAIRWLGWCGFVFVRRLGGFGAGGEDFLEFVRMRDV